MVDRLTRRSQQIATFPLSGRVVREIDLPQIREVIEGSFRIIYYIKADGGDVLAVYMVLRIRRGADCAASF